MGRGRWQQGTVYDCFSFIPSSWRRRRWDLPREGAWHSAYCLIRGILPPANNVGQRCLCQSALILTQSRVPAGARDLERQACPQGGMTPSVPRGCLPTAQQQVMEIKQYSARWASYRSLWLYV